MIVLYVPFVLLQNYPHDPASIFTHTASPGHLNYTFEQVPCFRNCELIVKKRSSSYGANSNSSITCGRTPKLSECTPYSNL